ncbi:hypothetical protein ASG67_10870 [Sphingomonas sp. Leaf339]|uniref:hypothetical protein n=1 Tax=Sphingomonas sp. Leaf339 TaxID=1736343 RepID=UPI0006FE73F9|nr:hypothetical protein [Sphingomonas sp. Leaf339]KQU49623.1 hypothetical protein ASG67_10870 [Sphingomonas sp. Leaf339]
MIDRTPTPRDQRPSLPAFDPVPRRKPRHDGWTPARQVAFIEALADTGSVTRAAAQVNMSSESAYYLRRQPGAEGFARAWEAALDMGVLRLKDEAFDRALNGQLVPVIAGGQLIGYRRRKNDRLIMFILRHYGARPQSGSFRPARTPQAGATPVAPPANTLLAAFEGLDLDDAAQDQIAAILTACAARARVTTAPDDPAIAFVPARRMPDDHPDAIELTDAFHFEDATDAAPGNECWQTLDLPDQRDAIAEAVAAIAASKANGEWDRQRAESQAAWEAGAAKRDRDARFDLFMPSGRPPDEWKG